jgi:hypothetical protein
MPYIRASSQLAAFGRKQPFKMAVFSLIECPVSVKADIQELALEISARNDRFTPESGHSANIGQKGR